MNTNTFENLITNPYTWLFIIFTMALPYILQYMRRFYPEKLRKQMEKEEACTLELQQKPEMKRTGKYLAIGFFVAIILTICIYYTFDIAKKHIGVIYTIFLSPTFIYVGVLQHKIKKGKNCLQFYDKKEYLQLVGIFVVITAIIVTIVLKFFAK